MSPTVVATAKRRLPIRMLGELQVGEPGATLALPASRKTRALLAYLAVTAKQHRRAELCTLFWEDAADPRAGLRWSLTQLRQALGDVHRDLIRADRETVGLHGDRIDTDVAQLATLPRAPPGTDADLGEMPRDALAGILTLFRGEFLEGLDLPACYAYHEWCMAERDTAGGRREQILIALIAHDRDMPTRQLAHARALVALNPLSEPGHLALVSALVALGRRGDARAQHAQCCRIFESELGLKPPAGLDAVLADSFTPGPAKPLGLATVDPMATPFECPDPAPFVGREEEAAQLAASIDQLRTGRTGDVLLVSGVPGIGKSRLLDELASLVAAAGGLVVRGRAFEAERLRPFGFWIDALRGLSEEGLPPTLRAAVQPLHQAAAAGVPGVGTTGERERLFDAVRDLLLLRAQQGPVAVLVDDLQWIEDASAALLHYAIRQLAGSAVLFALGARTGELEDNASAQQLLAALAHERRLRRIALGPLRDEHARALVADNAQGDDVARIVARGQGHPMMLLELARSSTLPDASAGLIDRIVETRLSRLSPAASELLGWACAFGHSVPLEGLAAAQGATFGSLASALSELERHDLLRAAGDDGYTFSHDLVLEAAYGRIAQPRRRLMHKAIALTLSRDMETSPASASEVAYHAGLGAQHALAARAAICAGEHGLRLGANREAAELARRGRRQAARVLDKPQRSGLAMALLRIQVLASSSPPLARLRPTVDTIALAISDARTSRLHDAVAQGHYLLSVVHQEAGRLDAARQATLDAAEAAQRSDRLVRSRQLANSARCLVELGRDIGQARDLMAQALELSQAAGVQEIEVHWCQGLLLHWDGELGPALRALDMAITLATQQEDRWRQCKCLAAAAIIEIEWGAPAAALKRADALSLASREQDDATDAPLAQALRAIAHRMAGEPAPALAAAIEGLRCADDKSRLASVLNVAASVEQSRHAFDAAGGYAAEALAVAQAIGDANESVVAQAILSQLAVAQAGPRPDTREQLQALRPVLVAPGGFSARARRAASDAMTGIQRDNAARSGPTPR